ncbi:SPOCS domain-containing protein [Pelosinus propionicus]|uniref:SH3 domain-containing protein n=1 Tax=Pelosinus propionicus DSM 13327 TaxID=1123291 RepID=A0A1I4JA90_9FIRM|nr:SPOCS domain-containing protein [Pelosinus propionicus]SFL63502.1 SH3 domain-containing protein [Pelosinus propionicus DSM 13327]
MSDEVKQDSDVDGKRAIDDVNMMCGCPEPGPETISVEQVLGAEMKQKVVEFDMTVPDPKPDIEQIIDVYVKDVDIDSVDVIRNKVIIRGDLEVKVMYVADLPNQPVHAFERRHVRFTRDIEIEGAEPGMDATADVVVEYVDYDFHCHHNRRKVHITIVLKFWARVIAMTEMDVYGLTPITEYGQIEYNSANSQNGSYASGNMGDDDYTVSASQTGGGDIDAVGYENNFITSAGNGEYENMYVTGPGITQTAGTKMGISGTATITGNSVNIRTGPGTNFPVVTKVNKGEQVTIKEQAFGWYKVVLSGGTTGWVASWLANTGTGAVPTAPKG